MTSPIDPIVGNQGLTYTSELGGGEPGTGVAGTETKNVTGDNTALVLSTSTTFLHITGSEGSINRIEGSEVDGHRLILLVDDGSDVRQSDSGLNPNVIWRGSPVPNPQYYYAGTVLMLVYSASVSKWFEMGRTPYSTDPYTG